MERQGMHVVWIKKLILVNLGQLEDKTSHKEHKFDVFQC